MDTANISTKPYLIRALYEWCLDCGCTPHLAVWVNEHTRVPAQYVQDNQIVLSISPSATKDLTIDNEWIHFHARFVGVSHEIWVPIGHVISLFAKETGEGMGFEVEPYTPSEAPRQPETPTPRFRLPYSLRGVIQAQPSNQCLTCIKHRKHSFTTLNHINCCAMGLCSYSVH